MQHEDSAKARAGWVAALAPALKVKPGAFGFMADGRRASTAKEPGNGGPEGTEPAGPSLERKEERSEGISEGGGE